MRRHLALMAVLAWLYGSIGYGQHFGRSESQHRKLLVVSVDGLDWRYLKDADGFGLRIPVIRKLLREGWHANGVVGVYPSVTWPSHTSIITGVRPFDHGILGNRRPKDEGGDYYWTPDLLKSPTLWQAAHEQGLTTASVTWPVTTGASITYDLPAQKRRIDGFRKRCREIYTGAASSDRQGLSLLPSTVGR